jgi:hypothetical protein
MEEFLSLTDLEATKCTDKPSDAPFTHVLTETYGKNYSCRVEQKVGHDFFFRIIADLEGMPISYFLSIGCQASAFDILADISKRPLYDVICTNAASITPLIPSTSLAYFHTRAMFPTSGRQALLLSSVSTHPRGLINLTTDYPWKTNAYTQDSSLVKMTCRVAGSMVQPHPSGDPTRCRVIQIVDGDLGGSIPNMVLQLVTTRAFPVNMRAVNRMLIKDGGVKSKSEMIADVYVSMTLYLGKGKRRRVGLMMRSKCLKRMSQL